MKTTVWFIRGESLQIVVAVVDPRTRHRLEAIRFLFFDLPGNVYVAVFKHINEESEWNHTWVTMVSLQYEQDGITMYFSYEFIYSIWLIYLIFNLCFTSHWRIFHLWWEETGQSPGETFV